MKPELFCAAFCVMNLGIIWSSWAAYIISLQLEAEDEEKKRVYLAKYTRTRKR